jgi:glycosyltransferase involved in cell wall biosynthesis
MQVGPGPEMMRTMVSEVAGQGPLEVSETAPKRVLQIGNDWFPESAGGAARYYWHLLRALGDLGVDVRGLVIGSDLPGRETNGRVTAFAHESASLRLRLLAARRALTKLSHDYRPELIVSHFPMFAFPALDEIGRFPFVAHFHGPWAAESRAEGAGRLSASAKQAIETLVYRRADRCIVLSEAFQRILIRRYGIREERVHVVPGGVDILRFNRRETRGEARQTLCWPLDRPIVLAVRRLRHRMGLGTLITAMDEVRRGVPEALLLIAGQGPLRATLERQVAALQLQDYVRFLGFVPDADLPLAYRAADLVVMPSQSLEGFGLTAVEALAAGTPALVTPVGGLPEVVGELDHSLVFDGCQAKQIADGIVRALRGPSTLPSSARCAEFARRNYDWRIVAWAVLDVYRRVI